MEIKNSNGVKVFTQDPSAFREGVGYELWKVFDSRGAGCVKRFHREKSFFENSEGIPNIPQSFLIDSESYKIGRPLIRGDSLNAYQHSLTVPGTVHVLLEWAKSLKEIHNGGMIYCDIKPANAILGDNGSDVTLIDFDGVEFPDPGKDFVLGMSRGTFPYFAPERLMREQSFTTYASDTFGLGIMAHYLLKGAKGPYKNGFLPCSLHSRELDAWEKEISNEIINKDAKPLKSGSKELDEIVHECVQRSHLKRIKDGELVASLTDLELKYR